MKPTDGFGSTHMKFTGQEPTILLNRKEAERQSEHLIVGFRPFWKVKEVRVSILLRKGPELDLEK